MNTIWRPPVKRVAPPPDLLALAEDLAHLEEGPPAFLRTLEAAPRADAPTELLLLRAERAERLLLEEEGLGPMSGMGITLGYSSKLNSFVHNCSNKGLMGGT